MRRDIGRRRGQTLALFSLTMLLLGLMVLMTVSVGMNAARKTDLNNEADAAAYAAAVATARTFNTAALLNRAIVAHYVTMAGIEAQMAYVSESHNAFNMAAIQFRMFDMSPSVVSFYDAQQGLYQDGTARCSLLRQEVRDASYEMWHAALFYYSPNPQPKWLNDGVDGRCYDGKCDGRRPFARADGWLLEGLPELEKRAGEQLKSAHGAIHELGQIQRTTYVQLYNQLTTGSLSGDIIKAANGGSVRTEARVDARRELNFATQSDVDGQGRLGRDYGFERGLASVIMGSRPRKRLTLMGPRENASPLYKQLQDFAKAAFAAYPEQPFGVSFTSSDIEGDYTWWLQDNDQDVPRRFERPPTGEGDTTGANELANEQDSTLNPGMGFAYGRAQAGRVVTTYNDACAGRQTRSITSLDSRQPGVGAGQRDAVTGQQYFTLPMGVMIRSSGDRGLHVSYASDHLDGAHWAPDKANGPMGCHKTHAHYNSTDSDEVHRLEHQTLPEELLNFVLPAPASSEVGAVGPGLGFGRSVRKEVQGAHGLWGQPVLPVFLSRTLPLSADPWSLRFHFGFSRDGADVNMQRPNVMNAAAAGVAHYHRRGHLGEPPNLLNPFWRATLQPMEIDQRGPDVDPTDFSKVSQTPMARVLATDVPHYPQARDAAAAYRLLKGRVYGMSRQPAATGGYVR